MTDIEKEIENLDYLLDNKKITLNEYKSKIKELHQQNNDDNDNDIIGFSVPLSGDMTDIRPVIKNKPMTKGRWIAWGATMLATIVIAIIVCAATGVF